MQKVVVFVKESEKTLIADFAKASRLSVSELMRRCALERIEDELDAEAWETAKAEFDANPVAIPADDIAEKYLR